GINGINSARRLTFLFKIYNGYMQYALGIDKNKPSSIILCRVSTIGVIFVHPPILARCAESLPIIVQLHVATESTSPVRKMDTFLSCILILVHPPILAG